MEREATSKTVNGGREGRERERNEERVYALLRLKNNGVKQLDKISR